VKDLKACAVASVIVFLVRGEGVLVMENGVVEHDFEKQKQVMQLLQE